MPNDHNPHLRSAVILGGLYASMSYALKLALTQGIAGKPFDDDWLEEFARDCIQNVKNSEMQGVDMAEETTMLGQIAEAFETLLRAEIASARDAADNNNPTAGA